MSTETAPSPTRRPEPRTATPGQLSWLRREVPAWTAEGLLEPEQAQALLQRYHASRRLSVGRLLLVLGACFVGAGVIWLVAANLDELSLLGRFLLVAAAWLGLLVGAEVLAARTSGWAAPPRTLVLALRTLASLVFGAVVFQAAQNLQVPAYEPSLVGWWAIGALVHAYGVRSFGPLLVGLLTGLTWFLWVVLEAGESGLAVVLALLAVSVLAAGLAAVHTRVVPEFSDAWRQAGAFLALAGLFAAALPVVTPEGFAWSGWLVAGLAVSVAAAAAGVGLVSGRDRLEPLAAVAVAALGVLLVLWDTGADTRALGAEDWLHAVVSVGVYVVVAVAVAVLGTLRDSWSLTAMAMAGLVVFTTFQSFSVFARIIEGAWLFLVLGLVFLATGVLFDRARRRLAAALDEQPEGS